MGLVVAGAGCTLEDDAEDGDAQQDELRSGGPTCRTCGYSNSPMLGAFALDGFVIPGAAAPQSGLRLIGITEPNGAVREVKIRDDEFVSLDREGHLLVGWSLVFENSLGDRFDVEIAAYSEEPNWATGELVPSYTLLYRDPASPDGDPNICPGVDPDNPSIVLIAGERYDFETKTVIANEPDYVTLACHGHAIAKLRMLGYGPNDDLGSTREQRQATLKMLTADYCGDGTSFTDIGQPLDWADGLFTFRPGITDPSRVEAKWTSAGATCLDKPRVRERLLVEGLCTIPKCGGDYVIDAGIDWVSFHP